MSNAIIKLHSKSDQPYHMWESCIKLDTKSSNYSLIVEHKTRKRKEKHKKHPRSPTSYRIGFHYKSMSSSPSSKLLFQKN